jgi:Txe/YoeB family toxin of Txe-Axe toxin-antitoxin module
MAAEKRGTILKNVRESLFSKFGKNAEEFINAEIYHLVNKKVSVTPDVFHNPLKQIRSLEKLKKELKSRYHRRVVQSKRLVVESQCHLGRVLS